MRRIVDLAEDLEAQLTLSVKHTVAFSLSLDDSLDLSDTAQLVIFIRAVNKMLEVREEMLDLMPLKDTTTGQDVFDALGAVMEKFGLPWELLTSIATDGAPAMTGKISGLIGRVQREMKNRDLLVIPIHCLIHQQNLCCKSVKLNNVMNLVVKITNSIRAKGFNHRLFKAFLDDISCEYGDLLYHCEVRWLSRAKVLERFMELRQEIALFMEVKGETVPELSHDKWICDLAFLTDITGLLRDLCVSLQGKDILIIHFFDKIKAFKMKLSLWERQLEARNVSYFPKLLALTNVATAADFGEYTDLLRKLRTEFETRFSDISCLEADLEIFTTPYSVDVHTVSQPLQMEVIDLQCDSELKDRYQNRKTLGDFYKHLSQKRYPKLHRHAARMLSLFGSTYSCEQFFSMMKMWKTRLRCSISDYHLKCVLRLSCAKSATPTSKH